VLAAAWGWRVLDALALGEATAPAWACRWRPARRAGGVLALATGTAVAQTGLIAFVGLAAPHLVRSAVRVTHGRLVLLASLMGGAAAGGRRHAGARLLAPQELPVGVLTAVLGGGYLLWLMHRRTATRGYMGL
jgi:iron complex transport system permease protein